MFFEKKIDISWILSLLDTIKNASYDLFLSSLKEDTLSVNKELKDDIGTTTNISYGLFMEHINSLIDTDEFKNIVSKSSPYTIFLDYENIKHNVNKFLETYDVKNVLINSTLFKNWQVGFEQSRIDDTK